MKIVVRELGKSFGDLVAVGQLNFEIRPGETFGLLGPNGAGKSTTINMIVGLTQPDRGEVQIGTGSGMQSGPPSRPEIRRRIGISPQSLSLYEELTARENLDFFGSLYGLSGSALRARTDWSLEFAGLVDRQRGRVAHFSGGMKRRLNLAAALMHEPEILVLDEPTVGVDPQSRNHIFDSIETLKQSGLTVIYTTHYMEEAQRLCDRVAIIDQGKLLALDTVDRLIEQHGGDSNISAEFTDAPEQKLVESAFVRQLQRDGNRASFVSPAPFDAIAELNRNGLRFETLNIARPNLESVFLSLTRRNLRD